MKSPPLSERCQHPALSCVFLVPFSVSPETAFRLMEPVVSVISARTPRGVLFVVPRSARVELCSGGCGSPSCALSRLFFESFHR